MLITCAVCLLPILLVWPIGPCIVVALNAKRERAEAEAGREQRWQQVLSEYAARGIN